MTIRRVLAACLLFACLFMLCFMTFVFFGVKRVLADELPVTPAQPPASVQAITPSVKVLCYGFPQTDETTACLTFTEQHLPFPCSRKVQAALERIRDGQSSWWFSIDREADWWKEAVACLTPTP